MRNLQNALALMCSIAAVCACDLNDDPPVQEEPDSGTVDAAGLMPLCDGVENGSCLCGSAVQGSTQYFFCRDTVTWQEARDLCRSFGGGYELLRIDSAEEQTFVWDSAVASVGRQDFWIGLNDLDAEGLWTWLPSGELGAGFSNWAPEQPDSGGPELMIEEDCVEILELVNGQWNDKDCATDYLDFICEGPL